MIPTLLALGMYLVTGYVETGPTADGTMVGPGVAACPPSFAKGTVLEVEGVGRVACHDAYAPWLSDRIDCWVASVPRAYEITGMHQVWLVVAS